MAQFVRVTSSSQTVVLRVAGEIDMADVEELKAAVRPCFSDGATVELDLSGLAFMDSSGLGALVQLVKEAAAQGSSIVLTNVSARIHRLLEVTGLSHVLEARDEERGPDDGDLA